MIEKVGQWAIKTENLKKVYAGRVAIEHLNFHVPHGTIHGFLGPNGAGKTTTLKMLAGLLRPTEGKVFLNGLNPYDDHKTVAWHFGLLSENPPLYPHMSVREYLEFVAAMRGIGKSLAQNLIDQTCEQVGLKDSSKRLIEHLSKGMKQRIGLAQALLHRPPIIILDEPTSGLDPRSVVEMRELLLKLKSQHTILFSSHILSEVEEICDGVTIIDRGHLKASGPLKEIKNNFFNRPSIIAEVGTWNESLDQKLKSSGLIQNVISMVHDNRWRLALTPHEGKDVRPQLAQFFVTHEADLWMMNWSQTQLEDVFLAFTQQKVSEQNV